MVTGRPMILGQNGVHVATVVVQDLDRGLVLEVVLTQSHNTVETNVMDWQKRQISKTATHSSVQVILLSSSLLSNCLVWYVNLYFY